MVHTKKGETKIVAIPFQNIRRVYVGFNEAYRRRETRGGFDHEAPLRIEYAEGNSVKTIYVFVDFDRLNRSTKNQEWLDILQKRQHVDD